MKETVCSQQFSGTLSLSFKSLWTDNAVEAEGTESKQGLAEDRWYSKWRNLPGRIGSSAKEEASLRCVTHKNAVRHGHIRGANQDIRDGERQSWDGRHSSD